MRNVVENMFSFLIIGIMLIALFIGMSIGNYMVTATENVLDNRTNSSLYTQVKTDMAAANQTFYDAVKFLIYFIIALSIYSSFVQVNNLQSFIMNFILSIVIGAMTLYLLTNIYNTYVIKLSAVPIFDVSEMFTFFFDSIHLVLIANICAFLLGFIFLKKAVVT